MLLPACNIDFSNSENYATGCVCGFFCVLATVVVVSNNRKVLAWLSNLSMPGKSCRYSEKEAQKHAVSVKKKRRGHGRVRCPRSKHI